MYKGKKALRKTDLDKIADYYAFTFSLSKGAKKLYRYLLEYPKDTRIKNKTIAKGFGVSEQTIYTWLKELRDKGLALYDKKPRKKK